MDISFAGFTLDPVLGKSGSAGSLVVSVRSNAGTDPVAANNSVTIPVVVPGPPSTTPPPTTPAPTTVPPTSTPAPTITPAPPTSTAPPTSPAPPTSTSPAVPVPSPTPPASSGGGLPVTGSPSALVGGIGLAVLMLGALLFLVTRRRRVTVTTPEDDLP